MAFDAKSDNSAGLYSLEAEQALLGAILYDNDIFHRCSALEPDDFHDPNHALIFAAILKTINAGRKTTLIGIDADLRATPGYQESDVRQYLESLIAATPGVAGAPDYATMIAECAQRRALIRIADEIAERARGGDDPKALIEDTEEALLRLGATDSASTGVTIGAALSAALDRINKLDGEAPGHLTGWRDLDDMLGGFRPGKLYIIAGRPGQGKTTYMTALAARLAEQGGGGGVAISTLEMEAPDLPVMMITDMMRDRCVRLPYAQAERGLISPEEFQIFSDCARIIERLPIIIDDTPAATSAHLRRFARRCARKFAAQGKPMRALIIDYLGLIEKDSRLQNVDAIQAITRALMGVARELNIPVICGCQLNRQVENRDDKRPQLADLRESGAIEQDAFAVIFLYREIYYLSRAEPSADKLEKHKAWCEEMDRLRAEKPLEAIVAKNRRGPSGTVIYWGEMETAAIRNRDFNPLDPAGADRRQEAVL